MSACQCSVRFRCDLCGLQSHDTALPAGEVVNLRDASLPERWTSLDHLNLTLRDLYGAPVTHLCPACSALSIGQVAERLKIVSEVSKHG